jgi:hypothetical protein
MVTARSDAVSPARRPNSLVSRLTAAGLAAWGAFLGIAPHVLHHAGPLAGAAIVAGASGQLIFLGLGLVASIPFLRRLHRRFQTWIAPALALALFVVAFAFSTLVVGPALTGSDARAKPGIEQPAGHTSHHSP